MVRILPLLVAILFVSCKSKEERAIQARERIDKVIAKIEAEIAELTKPRSCATDPADCRGRWVSEGDGCSPYFIYNIKDVDPIELDAKFAELRKWEESYMIQNPMGPMCDRINPDSLFVKDCKCQGAVKKDR
ncbi:hypothetical protein DSL64_04555 [Dyadobacter luteus]|uniref:Uncharacterized protein n=1 Tax=Dyadobacter luteus TaxID=2259619 RepID=A0A3D8YH29_9BACT|nr:hypothetical protein [Dyadobacter luteus]REA63709.1 hypothetical protein DSL64_04555 [Dyadobacter luteus]